MPRDAGTTAWHAGDTPCPWDTAGCTHATVRRFHPRHAMTDPELLVRRATAADAEAFARIMGDPEVFPNLMQMPMASEEMWR